MVDRIQTQHEMILSVQANQLTAALGKVDKELNDTAVAFDRAQAAGKKFEVVTTRTAASAKKMTAANKNMAMTSRRMQSSLQNTGYQLQDIAVQISSGQSVTRALSQQLPQLASGFGLVGVAVGTAAAVLVPLIGSLIDFGEEAENFEDAMEGLASAMDGLAHAAEDAQKSSFELFQTYQGAAGNMAEVNAALRDVAYLEALQEGLDVVTAIADEWGDLNAIVQQGEGYTATGLEMALGDIQDMLGKNTHEVTMFGQALADLSNARGPDDIADALNFAREQLELAAGSTADMNEATLELYRNLLEAERSYAELAAIDAATGISAAADAAGRLADNTAAAAREWVIMQGLRSRFAGEDIVMGMPTTGTRGMGDPIKKPGKKGGSGKTEAEKQAEKLTKALEKAAKAADDLNVSLDEALGSALKGGIDAFVDGLAEGELNMKEFTRSIMQDLGKILLRSLIISNLMRSFGGTPGSPATFWQSVVQNAVGIPQPTMLAKGGIINSPTLLAGGAAIGGEAGPEAVVPLRRGSDGNLGVGSPGITINNYSGQDVSVSEKEGMIEIAVGQARQASASDFARSMASGQGSYARALEVGYSSRRRAV